MTLRNSDAFENVVILNLNHKDFFIAKSNWKVELN